LSNNLPFCLTLFTYSDFLEPYKPRPETTASTARNLVHGALGLRRPSSDECTKEHKRRSKKSDGNYRGVYVIWFVVSVDSGGNLVWFAETTTTNSFYGHFYGQPGELISLSLKQSVIHYLHQLLVSTYNELLCLPYYSAEVSYLYLLSSSVISLAWLCD